MISAWLSTDKFFSVTEEQQKFSIKSVCSAFLNRYMRLTPIYALVVGFHATWLRHMESGPNWRHYIGREFTYCRKNWLTNILYINNYIDLEHMCLPTTWYLALDTQYFAIILIILMIVKHRPKIFWYLLTLLLGFSMFLTFYENDVNDFTMLMLPYPESLYDMKKIYKYQQFHIQYISVCGNLAGPLIGLGFGYIYYKNKNHKIFQTKFHTITWWIVTHGLGYGLIILSGTLGLSEDVDHDRVWASIYTAISRALFSFAIGFGILGCTNGVEGIVKWVLEWPPLYILGRLSYSAYLVHIPLIIWKVGISRYPIYANEFYLFYEFVGNVSLTYMFACVVTLLFEMPLLQLQKILMPIHHNCDNKLVNKCDIKSFKKNK